MKRHTFTISAIFTAGVLLMGACSPKSAPAPTSVSGTAPTAAAGYPAAAVNQSPTTAPAQVSGQSAYPIPEAEGVQIQVVTPDGATLTLSGSILKNMTPAKVDAGGKTENGLKLADLLAQINITDYSQVVVTGASGSLTLTKDQVSSDGFLTFPGQASADLVGSAIPSDQWVKGVTTIEVK